MAETVYVMAEMVEQIVEKTLFKGRCELGFSGQTLCWKNFIYIKKGFCDGTLAG